MSRVGLCLSGGCSLENSNSKKFTFKLEKKQIFPEQEIWKCLIHILYGLSYIHSKKICHRDIKSSNIFIGQDSNGSSLYKLGDFNVSKIQKLDWMKTQTGTPYYCAPEIWRQ